MSRGRIVKKLPPDSLKKNKRYNISDVPDDGRLVRFYGPSSKDSKRYSGQEVSEVGYCDQDGILRCEDGTPYLDRHIQPYEFSV